MPIPLVFFAYAAGAAVVAALGASAVVYRHEIWAVLAGRPIAVLGQRSVGKTVLLKYLTEENLVTTYDPTRAKTPGKRGYHRATNDNSSNLYVAKTTDVSGDEVGRASSWKDLFFAAAQSPSGLCLYLFDASKVLAGDEDHAERISKDAQLIDSWVKESSQPGRITPRLFVIGTHADKIPAWASGDTRQRSQQEDSLRKHPVLRDFDGLPIHVNTFLVSLGTSDGFDAMLDLLCNELTREEK